MTARRADFHKLDDDALRASPADAGQPPQNMALTPLWLLCHTWDMSWAVEIADEFLPEFTRLQEQVRIETEALSLLLEQFGPRLKRPHADTLKGSRHSNMKELRFKAADGVWRVAFAFDPERKAILLVAGDKSGGSEKRFYRDLIQKADDRFAAHLKRIRKERN
jgi:hypothetical protein